MDTNRSLGDPTIKSVNLRTLDAPELSTLPS